MAGAEVDSGLLSSLPAWAQIAANLGVFTGAIVVAAYGFFQHFKDKAGDLSEPHASFLTTGDDIRELKEAMNRVADVGEAILKIMQNKEHYEDLQREVARQLKEHGSAKGRV